MANSQSSILQKKTITSNLNIIRERNKISFSVKDLHQNI